jgi:transposase
VFVERLDWLAKNPRFTQRFAMHVGALCREMTNTAVAQAERLHDSTVKDLDRIYMQQQVARAGLPAPRAIGVDEIAIRKGHDYRIVVSDLDRRRPIWVGGKGRTEADMDLFFATLGAKKTASIQLAAMDMWKPFRASLTRHAPHARVIFDKFHIVRHLGDALDAVRRSEYRRLAAKDRAFFTRWKQSLKWQRLTSYETFAAMIERHWDGIASYCHPENKVSLGLVEGLNNKIRVLQRRAYGYRDEDYLKLKIVAAFLPPLTRRAEKDPL